MATADFATILGRHSNYPLRNSIVSVMSSLA